MGIILGVVAAVLAIVAVVLAVRSLEQVATNNELREEALGLQRENRRLSEQIQAQTDRHQKVVQEISSKGGKAKGPKQRLAKLHDELQSLHAEQKKTQERVRELSATLNRVRISREEQRQELAGVRARLAEAPAVSASTLVAPPASDPPAGAKTEPSAERAATDASLAQLNHALEHSEYERVRFSQALGAMRKDLVARTAELRALTRKNEHNRRAWIITQHQLDLLADENYTLKHGHPPTLKQADKQAAWAALRPGTDEIIADPNAEPIELPGVREPDDEPEPPIAMAELAVEPTIEAGPEAESPGATAEPAIEVESPGATAEPAIEVESPGATAKADLAVATEPEPVVEVVARPEPTRTPVEHGPSDGEGTRRSTVRLRKAAARARGEDRGDDGSRPVAPPRPGAPPRPNIK